MQHIAYIVPVLAAIAAAPATRAQTLPTGWDRDKEWTIQPDSAAGTTQGNPAADSEDNLVWHFEYASTGGDLASADPWYAEPTTLAVWDTAWYSSVGAWVVADDFGTVIKPHAMTHSGQWSHYKPIVRHKNVTGQAFDVGITGTYALGWNGDFSTAPIVDVDVVVAHRDGGTGSVTLLYSATIPKPNNDTTPESVRIPIDLAPLTIGVGDEILISLHAFDSTTSGKWVTLGDSDIAFVRDPIGTRYCGPGVLNSSGTPGQIGASGSDLVGDNELTLKSFQLPAETFGFYLASLTQGFVMNPGGSDGNLCLGGAIGRFVGPGEVLNTGLAGAADLTLDLDAFPSPSGPVQVHAGETWSFQFWHRDGSSSNFTDAIAVSFF